MPNETLLDYVYTAHRYLTELESTPRDYGTGHVLFSSEIHTVTAVNRRPGCNLTILAAELGVSKAAASKFVAKLIESGFLTKSKAPGNDKDVLFNLTELGMRAAKGHTDFEKRTFGPLRRVEKSLSREARITISDYFMDLFRNIP